MSADQPYTLDDYDFELPDHLIAQEPAAAREGSRLLVIDRKAPQNQHQNFPDIVNVLKSGDLLVLNETKVIPARLFGTRQTTKGKAEILLLSPQEDGWEFLLKTRGKPAIGEILEFANGQLLLTCLEKRERGRWLGKFQGIAERNPLDLIEEFGVMPLPPYIKRRAGEDERAAMDKDRYQTVFANHAGAVAAPTAGLHFTHQIFSELKAIGVSCAKVTLHVGLGTFQPIEAEDFRDHNMHAEIFDVPEETATAVNRTRQEGGRVIAIGTTSLRSLESAWNETSQKVEGKSGTTRLFLYPPQRVNSIDGLFTNFHLPRSSLMLLVSAFAGRDRIMEAYREAVQESYRFFSYGDAMLIL